MKFSIIKLIQKAGDIVKHTIIGTLAHVDAGKTTLSEAMLYLCKSIRKLGRVDHGDAFLDYHELEKNRGITIYMKQARMVWKDLELTLIDTPGHIDFSTEMERTLQILDYAVLIINGMDGVQAHTETIWKLLKHYHIPVFLFINKMDMSYKDSKELMLELQKKLDGSCVDFTTQKDLEERIAMCDDTLLDIYMDQGTITKQQIEKAISKRILFPCYFGSALKQEGVEAFLDGLQRYTISKQYPKEFGAKVYKISCDEQGNQLTHLKITGGALKTKTKLENEEKVDQIRLYSGNKYQMVHEVTAGQLCAIKGFTSFLPGDGLGIEPSSNQPVLSSYMNYRIVPPAGYDQHLLMTQLLQLTKEDPQLHITFVKQQKEIRVALMGEIQIEVLKRQIYDRFNVMVSIDSGSVIYKETIMEPIEGVGHFEPLRHYAEVHLLLEPAPRGSGLSFHTQCPEDQLARHWQRLVFTHLEEKEHVGVLTGSSITDMRITLLAGKAHPKHTEGGDFREATYRAIRHGLKLAKCILLEPYYQFQLELPNAFISKAVYDIERMHGTFEIRDIDGDFSIIEGKAPVSAMQNYALEVISYTKGKGKLTCVLKDYEPCIDQEAMIAHNGYDSESDIENPTGSIFCANGAGFYVKYDEVYDYMHIKRCYQQQQTIKETNINHERILGKNEEEELEEIFKRTYGEPKTLSLRPREKELIEKQNISLDKKPQCILVDGYNVIHAWKHLAELATTHLDAARMKLMDAMCNYQGYKNCLLILVFDAYQVKEGIGSMNAYHNIYIVYTRKAQTADMYIERATHKMAKDYQVTVVTSDAMEQLIVIGQGAHRMSSRELQLELKHINKKELKDYESRQKRHVSYLLEDVRDYNEEEDE